jgi:glycosyltransferase involved in cell wall biosynthesis
MKDLSILVVGPYPPETGGPASHVYDMVRALSDDGYRVCVVCREDPVSHRLFTETSNYEVLRLKGWDFRSVFSFRKFYGCLTRCDIIHAHTFKVSYLMDLARRFSSQKLVSTLHSYFVEEELGRGKNFIQIGLDKFIEKRVVTNSDAIITVDNRIAKWVSVKYGIAVNAIVKNSLYMQDYSNLQNITKDEYTVVCPRHLYPKNGVHIAVEAMRLLMMKGVNLKLIIVGEGPERNRIERMLDKYELRKNVLLLGNHPRSRTVRLIAHSTLTLVPSIPLRGVEEATSISVLESMAVKTPVVASNIGGLKELIKHGETGFLVEPGVPKQLADAIELLLVDTAKRKALGKRAYDYVRMYHDWAKNIKLIESVYDSAML